MDDKEFVTFKADDSRWLLEQREGETRKYWHKLFVESHDAEGRPYWAPASVDVSDLPPWFGRMLYELVRQLPAAPPADAPGEEG